MTPSGLRVGVAFGGRSVEHDVSIISGLQALGVLEERHAPVPIYIARSGRWYTGEALRELSVYQQDPPSRGGPPGGGRTSKGTPRGAQASRQAGGGDPEADEVNFDLHNGRLLRAGAGGGSLLRGRKAPESIELDVVVLATHGTQGEDGCLQGALELAQLPYVGPSVGAAAAAMDKVATKAVLAQAGLPALDYVALRREEWDLERSATAARARASFDFPMYVKPASLGSSVGVRRCTSEAELIDALELCFELDRACLLEPSVEGGVEVNCSVIGRPGVQPRASVCEQPVLAEEFLSFEDKYMSGAKVEGMKGAQRLIPAPLPDELTAQVQDLSTRAFTAFACAGVTRVDFLIDAQQRVYVNELNTIPGSFAFYLWEPAGLPFVDLMDELIDFALAEQREKLRTTTVFATNLLAERVSGAKAGEKT
jgi:D-alanine-D-alanine ligase